MELIDRKHLGQRIEAIRKELGFTQAELAVALKVSQSAISKYLTNRMPPADVLFRLAQLGKTTVEWILTGKKSYLYRHDATRVQEEKTTYDADLSLARQIARLPQEGRQALVTLIHLLTSKKGN